MHQTMAQEDGEREQRESSVSEAELVDELAPLLPHGTEPALYKTISRLSDAGDLPTDEADLELAKHGQHVRTETAATGVYATISVLLLGVFVSQTDQSLVLATYSKVASNFHDFESASWIISAYILAQCVAQPLYGKLSDIYGRKACLQTSYLLFTIGTAGTGLGQTMAQVIAARAVQGCGAAGMTSMVSIIVTDLVPLHEVATLRSYINVLQTTGRSCGGVIGGALTQALGWRWAFLVQVPPSVIAMLLVQWRLHMPLKHSSNLSRAEKLKRVDFAGATFLCATIFSAAFVLDTGGQKYAWDSMMITVMGLMFAITFVAFIASAKLATEPIFPLRLLGQYPVWTNYLICALQVLVQFSLMMIVPVYFQVTAKAKTAQAGAYLIPAFLGNTIGGLASGYWIKYTGRYKWPTVVAPFLAMVSMTLCYTTWNGHTGVFGSLATLPGGMAAGIVSSSAFVGLAAGVAEEDMAVAGSGLYLFFNLGAIAGSSAGSAVYQTTLKTGLKDAVQGVPDGRQVMQRALESITYVQNASEQIRERIVPAFVNSLHQVNLLEMSCVILCLFVASISQQKRLKR